MESNN